MSNKAVLDQPIFSSLERLVDALERRGLVVPKSLDEAIKVAANVLIEDGTILASRTEPNTSKVVK